jgi:hypothetical protein
MSRKERLGIKYYLAEIIILIFGISISFLLNEWRLNHQERVQQVKLLESFRGNLALDSISIDIIVKSLERQEKAISSLLALEKNSSFTDSTALNLLLSLNYSPFTPTQITYEQMKSQGSSSLIQNDSLAKKLISLYEVVYKTVEEWVRIDASQVTETLIPYTSKNFPFIKGLNYPLMSDRDKARFMQELSKDEFLYIIQFLQAYKGSTKQVFKASGKDIASLLALLDVELKQLE